MLGKLSLLFFEILAAPLASAGSQYDHDNVVGEWIQYSRNENGEFGYYYLNVEPDFSGLFSYQLYGSEPVVVPIADEYLSLEDGFFVLDDREFRRIVFSAYSGYLLTGVMWFYQENGGVEEPFNSFFLRLSSVSEENVQPDVLSVRSTVSGLSE